MPPTILLWVHDEDHEELLSYNLIRKGFIVSAVSAEDEIVLQAQEIKPDVILLGDCSSDQAFIDIVGAIKASDLPKIPPVVCLTTKNIPAEEHPVCKASDACLALPAKPKKIISIVRELLSEEDAEPCC